MLIGVVLLFFICRFPMLINHIFETKLSLTSYDIKDRKNFNMSYQIIYHSCRTRRLFNTTVNFLQTINASANLFFYYLFGENFRQTGFQLATLVRKRAIRRRNTIRESVTYYLQRRSTNPTTIQQNPTLDQQQLSNLLNLKEDDSLKKENFV